MARHPSRLLLLVVGLLAITPFCHACTNFLVTKGASADGSTHITYAADSHVLYGALYHYPAADHPPGTMRDVFDWDTGKYLGQIPEAEHTYNVVGNMNEHALSIAETTYGGVEELSHQTGALIDYGSLIYITLQRAKTAREAIHLMGDLTSTYGYASVGESFSIGDPNEVWVVDFIGKGEGVKGAVWVARRVPDGYVSAHANQARIQTFPRDDPDNCLYAPDVVDFARSKGLYPHESPEDQFSFSDVYDPVTFLGARACESRAWAFFRDAGAEGMDDYLEYVKGHDLTKRMPLWVRPSHKLTVNDTMNYMRNHFEDTWLDFRSDVGAQAFNMPYRWRPLEWKVGTKSYANERSTGTQQTGWCFVAQMRSWLPAPIGGLLWFGVDDTASTVFAPMYCGMKRVPDTHAETSGDMMTFSFDSAFWVFNMVTNFAYSRYNLVHPEVATAIAQHETKYFTETESMDRHAAEVFAKDPDMALDMVTAYSVSTGEQLTKEWLEFWKYLFTKYMDGNVKVKNPDPKERNPVVTWPGYPSEWLTRIVEETGDHYEIPAAKKKHLAAAHAGAPDRKLKLVLKGL